MTADPFSDYERSLEVLLRAVNKDAPEYLEILTLAMRLSENIQKARLYGDSETLRADRMQIISALDRFARKATRRTFSEIHLIPPEPFRPFLRPNWPFPGLRPYYDSEATIFFGRERAKEALAAKIERDPIVIVNGLSGCGKTSLIRAGVIPYLREQGYRVLYVSVYDNIVQNILREVWQIPGFREERDYVTALKRFGQEGSAHPPVLIVDQFEQALTPAHSHQALEEFLKGIPYLLNSAHPFAHMVIVVRADWLYFLEVSARQFYPRLNIHSCIFTVDPLSPQEAKEAIIGPLQGQDYDESVANEIVKTLQLRPIGPAMGPYIQPIQLQIVLDALIRVAEENGASSFLTEEIYQKTGGVDHILRTYLVRTLGHRPTTWRLLAHFIAPDGKTGRVIRQSEILAVPAAQDLHIELTSLCAQGVLEAQEAQDAHETYYRLAHDYLVEAIVDYLEQNPDQQGWKLAEEWLASGTVEWEASLRRGESEPLILEKNRYLQIYQYRDQLQISRTAQQLLLHTALHYGHEGVGYWLSRSESQTEDINTVVEYLLSPCDELQVAARKALAGYTRMSQETSEKAALMNKSIRKSLADRLREKWKTGDKTVRRAVGQALWTLQIFDNTAERLQVAGVVFSNWLHVHSFQTASYLFTVLTVLFLVGGAMYARERMRGHWESIYSLKAGEIPLAFVDPEDSRILYVLTQGGPGPWEGISLFAYQDGRWLPLSRNFGKGTPTAAAVIRRDGKTRIYISLYSIGILRSEDGGQTWEMVTRGLPSRGLTSLVADPRDSLTLYAGTDDWRGVLRSTDGGASWDFYDYGGEIAASKVYRLAYTGAHDGLLIAGMADGRILFHRRNSTNWELGFGLSRGAITSLVVAHSNPEYIYAGTTRGVVLRSRNGGLHWEVMGQLENEFEIAALAVAPDNPLHLFASAYGTGGYTFWESADGGSTWQRTPGIGLPRVRARALLAVGMPPYRLIAATTDGLFSSQDGGIRWEKELIPAPLAQIQRIATSAINTIPLYAVTGGSLYVSEDPLYAQSDKGHSWILGQGLEAETVRTVVVDPENPQVAFAGGLLQGYWSVFRTQNGGQTWERTSAPPIQPPLPDDTLSLAMGKTGTGERILYAGTMGCGLFRSMDSGQNWETFGRSHCTQGIENMPSDIFFLAVASQDPYRICAASGQQVFYSRDGGYTWRQATTPTTFPSPITGIAADPIRPDTFYLIASSGGFWSSEDGGDNWHQWGEAAWGDAELTALAAFPGEAGHLALGSSNGGVWITSDGGHSWRSVRENLPPASINSIATSESPRGQIIVGTPIGIAVFTPGQLWEPQR